MQGLRKFVECDIEDMSQTEGEMIESYLEARGSNLVSVFASFFLKQIQVSKCNHCQL